MCFWIADGAGLGLVQDNHQPDVSLHPFQRFRRFDGARRASLAEVTFGLMQQGPRAWPDQRLIAPIPVQPRHRSGDMASLG